MKLEEVRKELDEFKNKGEGNAQYFWKPEEGNEYEVRVVPYIHNMDYPFIKVYMYYNFDGPPIISPKCYGEDDPVWDFAEQLMNTGDKDEWREGRDLAPKLRIYAPVIVRGEEDEGPRFWGFSRTVYTDILSMIDSEESYSNIEDIKEGHDINIKYEKEKNAQYPTTRVFIRPKSTPAVTGKDQLKKIKEMPDIVELMTKSDEEELKQKLNDYLGNTDEKLTEDDLDEQFGDLDVSDSDNNTSSTEKSATDDGDEMKKALDEFESVLDE